MAGEYVCARRKTISRAIERSQAFMQELQRQPARPEIVWLIQEERKTLQKLWEVSRRWKR